MSAQYTCDRCGKRPLMFHRLVEVAKLDPQWRREYHLCDACAFELSFWMMNREGELR